MGNSANKQLFDYCKEGKTQLLLDALSSIYGNDIFDERGNSLLSIALKNGRWETANTLIEKEYICELEPIALIAACQFREDSSEGITIALQCNSNVNTQNPQKRTALMTSCLLGHFNKSKELINQNANCKVVDVDGNTALIDAVRAKNLKIVEIVLEQNNDINHVNNEGDTALHVVIKQKAPLESVLMALLNAGADPECVDNNKKSSWLIAKQKHVKLSRLIEKHLNNINQIELPFFTNDFTSEIKEETKNTEQESMEQSKINTPNKPLSENIRVEPTINGEHETRHLNQTKQKNPGKTKTPEAFNVFDFKDAKPARSNVQEWFHAAKNGNLGGLNRMIIGGIDIDCIDDKGCTALIRACGHSRRAVVSFLLQQKANIELRSKNGSTALSSSVIGNCRRVAGLLLEKGANPNGLGPADFSYTTIAAAQWNDAMLSILYRNGADIFIKNSKQQNLMHVLSLAVEFYNNVNNAKLTIQFLLDHGFDINEKDENGNTALMLVCGIHKNKYGADDRNIAAVAHAMIKLGAAAAITNNKQESALDAANLHKLAQSKGVLMNALSWKEGI